MIDEKDRLLLSRLQKGLSLVRQPFFALGAEIGLDAADVLLRIERLKREGFLSGIKAFWDPRAFCYQSAWVAMRFDPDEFDRKTEIIGAHPGVIYSAEREHELNFWFFIMVPPGHDPALHVQILEKQTTPKMNLFLPMRQLLKGVDLLHSLDERTYDERSEYVLRNQVAGKVELSLNELRVVRLMQDDFLITDEPYRRIAEEMGVSEGTLFDLLNGLIRKGQLKRIGTYSFAKKNNTEPKTLVVWKIPGEKLEKIAGVFKAIPEVLYADQRLSHEELPYSVYTLIKAKDPEALEALVKNIENEIGKWPYKIIHLGREIKKSPVKYFPKEFESWWVKNRIWADETLITGRRP